MKLGNLTRNSIKLKMVGNYPGRKVDIIKKNRNDPDKFDIRGAKGV